MATAWHGIKAQIEWVEKLFYFFSLFVLLESRKEQTVIRDQAEWTLEVLGVNLMLRLIIKTQIYSK